MEIDEKEYQALDSLRRKKVSFYAHEIREILKHYYPKGTTVTINVDCWKIDREDK